MDEQDKCLRDGCDTPINYGGVWGYCSEECLEEGTDEDGYRSLTPQEELHLALCLGEEFAFLPTVGLTVPEIVDISKELTC